MFKNISMRLLNFFLAFLRLTYMLGGVAVKVDTELSIDTNISWYYVSIHNFSSIWLA